MIYNHFDSEYYLDEKNISESELVSEDYCLVSGNFKNKYFENGKVKKEYVHAFNYLGCNLDKQLFYMHVLFDASPCNEQTQLVHYTIDKNGLMDDMYIVDVDYMNYNHCTDVPYNSLFTDTKYESGFVGLLNLNPFDDTEYGLEYHYGLSGTAIDKYRMHTVLPSIHRSNYVELVNDGEYISDYYERKIYVDEYFNDSIIRYEITFEIDDLLRLNNYSCKKISERTNDKKDDKFQKDDEGIKYFYKKTKIFNNNPNDFISIIANTNRNHRWNFLSISDSFFEKYGNTGIFITDYNNDDYYRWVKVNKIEKVDDYKYIVEIEYDSKEYRFNCQFNIVDNVLQDVVVKSIK